MPVKSNCGQRRLASCAGSSSAGTPHPVSTACSPAGSRTAPKSISPVMVSSVSPAAASSARHAFPACPVSRTYNGSG